MRMFRPNWSWLVTTSRCVVITVLLAALGLSIGIPSLADALDLRRKFYLTQDTFDGSQPLMACAKGFHMASLWEILDPSNLKYDTTRGVTFDDSGSGPPTNIDGWIRTGAGNLDSGGPGNANCRTWTSNVDPDKGTTASLETNWPGSGTAISPWKANDILCSATTRVWCVQH